MVRRISLAARSAAALLLLTLGISSCGHTNNLKEHQVAGKNFYYASSARADGASAYASINGPVPTPASAAVGVVAGGIVSGELQSKLNRVAKPEAMAQAVSRGMETALKNYSMSKRSENVDDAQFIVETVLKDYSIESSSGGTRVRVEAVSRIIQRGTGRLVWENEECESIPMNKTWGAGAFNPLGTVMEVYNATSLLNMSDEELARVLQGAAEQVGHSMAETLREDLAD